MNGYLAFYNGTKIEVFAKNLFEAKTKAVTALKVAPKKAHMVAVVLCEVDGVTVTHSTTEF